MNAGRKCEIESPQAFNFNNFNEKNRFYMVYSDHLKEEGGLRAKLQYLYSTHT